MTKQERIEKLTEVIRKVQMENFRQSRSTYTSAEQIAKELYDVGYRKIDGDDYVSREWHDKQVLCAENEVERLRTKLQQVLLAVDTVKEMNTMVTIDEHKKQAVKDFAEELKKQIANTMYCRDGYVDYDDTMDVIDELLKEFLEQ